MADILMYVHAITFNADSNSPIVILREVEGERILPIWIGLLEASAIAAEMEKIEFARPMTHDLLANILKVMDITIPKIEIFDLKDNTYYALMTIQQGDRKFTVDARPSDAVAIALRAGSNIFSNESLLKKIQPVDHSMEEKDEWAKLLEDLDPKAFKYKI